MTMTIFRNVGWRTGFQARSNRHSKIGYERAWNRFLRRTAFALGLLAFAAAASANDNVPAAKQDHPILFRGATVHTVSGDAIPEGQVLLADGKIQNVEARDVKINLAPGTEIIDVHGKHLYPGLIAANTVLGLTEIPRVRATVDMIEPGWLNPNARAQVAVNPDSELLPVARSNGVLVVQVVPHASGGGGISGTSAVMALDGWTWEDMTVSASCGLHISWPRMIVRERGDSADAKQQAGDQRKSRDERLARLEKAFDDARAYLKARAAAPGSTDTDLRWEAMRPLLDGEMPAFIYANTSAQIRAALAFAKQQDLKKVVIVGAQDAWRVADEMKAQGAAAIISPINELPLRRWEPANTPQLNPQRLLAAGVKFCIANEGSSFGAAHERNLPYQAARSTLSREEAIRSITLYPAQILGVADRLGSLEPGKDATLIVTDGDPLDIRTAVERAFIGGREIDLSNKQTRLYEKYKKKYGE